jgi:hypothetical protein
MSLFPDFDVPRIDHPERDPGLSADRRRTLRQRAAIDAGRHPLMGPPLADHPDARCGNCRFRELWRHHDRSYPKCVIDDGAHVSHSAASDVRAWWPGCRKHEWGEPSLSPDAARSGPVGES